jgi:hypothetical protein
MEGFSESPHGRRPFEFESNWQSYVCSSQCKINFCTLHTLAQQSSFQMPRRRSWKCPHLTRQTAVPHSPHYRCSFHAYADSTYAKHLENGASLYGTVGSPTPVPPMMAGGTFNPAGPEPTREFQQSVMEMSDDSINSVEQMAPNEWTKVLQNGSVSPQSAAPMRHEHVPNGTSSPNENGKITAPFIPSKRP